MLRNNSKNQIPKSDFHESEDLIFDNFSIGNATLNAGIDSNENTTPHNTPIQNSLPLSPKIINDNYSVNASLAAGIGIEDKYDLETLTKSMEYYNNIRNSNMFDGAQQPPLNQNYRQPFVNNKPLDTMMDYISKSQPLNGGNNLLTQYLKFSNNPNDSKGKEPEINEEAFNENINSINPSSWGAHSYSKQNYASSLPSSSPFKASLPVTSPKSTDNAIFDPNIYTIPSYKNKKNHIRRQSHNTKTLDDHKENENDGPLELKLDSYKKSQPSSNVIDIQESPINKNVYARSSRLPPPSPMDPYYGSFGSYSSGGLVGSIGTMNSSVLAKTSHYIPDASLPYLVKTIDHHLVPTDNHQNSSENLKNIYNRKGGDVARDIYTFNEKIKKTILNKHSKSEPNLYELNKKKEGEFNVLEIAVPGGFRREFMSSNAKKQGKKPPNWITSNFIDFLALYGHYAGDDDFDEDYVSENDSLLDWEEEEEEESEEEESAENEMDLIHRNRYENNNSFDDEKIKIIETQSSYEVINEEEYDRRNKSKLSMESESLTENTPLLSNSSRSSLKHKNRKHRNNNSSSQAGTASEGKTLFLLLKAFIGTGILFLPKAFSNGGLLFSLFLLALCGWLSYFAMILLVRCSEKFGGSYGDIGKLLFGKSFKYMIQFSISLAQNGSCCAYIIFVLQNIKSIISTVTDNSLVIPDWALILGQVLIYIPLSWIRKIQNFSFTSLIADIFIVIGIAYIICADFIIVSKEGHSNNFQLFNRDEFILFFGTAIYAFEGIGLVIPLQKSMKEPEKFPKVLKKSMIIISLAMFLVGGLSYYIFGDEVDTIILMNVFPDSIVGIIVRALYTMAIVFSFPLVCYPGIHIIEPLFIPRQRPFKNFRLKHKRTGSKNYIAMTPNPNTSELRINELGNSNNNSNLNLASSSSNNGKTTSNGLKPSTSYSSLSGRPKRDTGKNSKVIKWMKNIFRTIFVSLLGLISYYGAANLDKVVSIIGSLACIPLMFLYPPIMHYRGVAKTTSERAADIAIIIFGAICTVWITKLSIEEWK